MATSGGAGPDLQVTVSGARNRTHLLHVASWVRRAASGGASVAVVDHDADRAGRAIGPDDLASVVGSIPGVYTARAHVDSDDAEPVYVAVGAPGIKPWLRLQRRAGAHRRLRVVVVDEGLGTYGSWWTRRAAMRREGVSSPVAEVRATAVSLAAVALMTERWALYRQDGGSWSLNEEVADEFRSRATAARRSDLVLYLSQPWVELGVLSASVYSDHLIEIGEAVSAAGLRFAVRPHGAERSAGYGPPELLSSSLPAEIDPDVVAAAHVLGDTSTALLNVRALHGVPAARIARPADDVGRALGRRQRSLLDHILGAPVPVTALTDHLRRTTA